MPCYHIFPPFLPLSPLPQDADLGRDVTNDTHGIWKVARSSQATGGPLAQENQGLRACVYTVGGQALM